MTLRRGKLSEFVNSAKPPDRTLDATGLMCPEPVFRTRRALAEMEAGELLRVSADDPLVEVDISVFCQRTGHSMIESAWAEGRWTCVLRKTGK